MIKIPYFMIKISYFAIKISHCMTKISHLMIKNHISWSRYYILLSRYHINCLNLIVQISKDGASDSRQSGGSGRCDNHRGHEPLPVSPSQQQAPTVRRRHLFWRRIRFQPLHVLREEIRPLSGWIDSQR